MDNGIRYLRFIHGEMTQQELADRVGTTRQTIIAIEGGRTAPSVVTALRIAAVFGTCVDDLFRLSPETPMCPRVAAQWSGGQPGNPSGGHFQEP